MKYEQNDFDTIIANFQMHNAPEDRYSSFDYCHYYFRSSYSRDILTDIEKSCLVIGFYLASWGMLRGSSFLLQKSAKYYEPLIKYIATLDENVWDIDVDKYSKENIEIICEIYRKIKEIVVRNGNSHLTLVTKIMLGVFGFIPAFDQYVSSTFRTIFNNECGFRSLNIKSLMFIQQFYEHNREVIDNWSNKLYLRDFVSGKETNINYSAAKVIDMYSFTKGLQ